MKRVKSFLIAACTAVLALVMVIGGLQYPIYTAKADPSAEISLSNIPSVSSVEYGNTFNVENVSGITVSVTAPNGQAVTPVNNKVTADQLGVYTVTYAKDGNSAISYSFKVKSEIKNSASIYVDNDADIPTYIKKGGTATIPSAKVGYYDDDSVFQSVGATVTIKDDKGTSITAGENYTFSTVGSVFITYAAKLKDGTKALTKTYEVKVQESFKDEKAPTLTVSSPVTTSNVNTKITLPTATVSDTLDERVKVTISVKDPSGNAVKQAEVNDAGYATKAKSDDVVFDNDKSMAFYPLEEGTYTVVYEAVDDSGNKAPSRTFKITVSDTKSPEATIDDTLIPTEWGYSKVTDEDENELENLAVKFPYPSELIDNSGNDKIKISFTVKAPDDKTVLSFTNINTTNESDESAQYKLGETTYYFYNKGTAEESYLEFNFKDYKEAKDPDTYLGNYTITYKVMDSENTYYSKTYEYTLKLSDTFADSAEPTVEFADTVKDYFVATEDAEYTVPTPSYSSTTDSKLTLTYTIKSGDNTFDYAFKGGEVLVVSAQDDKYYLTVDGKDTNIEIIDSLTLSASVKSDAGNTASAEKTVKLITGDANYIVGEPDYEIEIPEISIAAGQKTGIVSLGSLVFSNIKANIKDYVGVEIGVRTIDTIDAKGNIVSGVYQSTLSCDYYYLLAKGALVFRNIQFSTATSGDYIFEVRLFDINGNSLVKAVKFTVEAKSGGDGGVIPTAAVNAKSKNIFASASSNQNYASSGEINTAMDLDDGLTYTLLNGVEVTGSYYNVAARNFTGGRFAIMGNEFTALTTGTYTVVDKPVVVSTSDITADATASDLGISDSNYQQLLKDIESYTFDSSIKFSDSTTAVLEVQDTDIIPSYVANYNENITLPAATVIKGFTTGAKVTVKVASSDGTDVTVKSIDNGRYQFKPEKDGTYTVTYSADGADSVTFTVKVGDVTAPVFTLTDSTGSISVKTGYSFSFSKIELTDETISSDFTFTKTITGPDGTVLGTVSGAGSSYASKTLPTSGEIELSESGKYTVRYEVKDKAGNVSVQEEYITVTGSSSYGSISYTALSTVLVIVGILLIAGVVIYLVRYRSVKSSVDKK